MWRIRYYIYIAVFYICYVSWRISAEKVDPAIFIDKFQNDGRPNSKMPSFFTFAQLWTLPTITNYGRYGRLMFWAYLRMCYVPSRNFGRLATKFEKIHTKAWVHIDIEFHLWGKNFPPIAREWRCWCKFCPVKLIESINANRMWKIIYVRLLLPEL